MFSYCQRAQRIDLSQREALARFRGAGLHISTQRFRTLWHAADASRVLLWNRSV